MDRLPKGMAIFEAMSGRHGQGSKLIEAPPVAVPDEHAELVKADQRFQAARQPSPIEKIRARHGRRRGEFWAINTGA